MGFAFLGFLAFLFGAGAAGCRLSLPNVGPTDGGIGDGTIPVDAAAADGGTVDAHDDAGSDAGWAADGGSGADAAGSADGGSGADAGVLCPPTGPLDCSPGPGTGEADQCFDGTSCFISNVQQAVQSVINNNPQWFDYNNPNNCPYILDVNAFMDAVVAHLIGQGLCAIRDPNAPNEEVTVKHDNSYSENFDIVASTGCARYGPAIYTSTCAPAWW